MKILHSPSLRSCAPDPSKWMSSESWSLSPLMSIRIPSNNTVESSLAGCFVSSVSILTTPEVKRGREKDKPWERGWLANKATH